MPPKTTDSENRNIQTANNRLNVRESLINRGIIQGTPRPPRPPQGSGLTNREITSRDIINHIFGKGYLKGGVYDSSRPPAPRAWVSDVINNTYNLFFDPDGHLLNDESREDANLAIINLMEFVERENIPVSYWAHHPQAYNSYVFMMNFLYR